MSTLQDHIIFLVSMEKNISNFLPNIAGLPKQILLRQFGVKKKLYLSDEQAVNSWGEVRRKWPNHWLS